MSGARHPVAALDEMNRRIDSALESALKYRSCGYDDAERKLCAHAPSARLDSEQVGASQVPRRTTRSLASRRQTSSRTTTSNLHVSGKHFRIIEPGQRRRRARSRRWRSRYARKLFVSKRHALHLLLGAQTPRASSSSGTTAAAQPGECTYGYSCSFTGDGNPTLITVLDISEPPPPVKVRELRLSGSYVNARQIGSGVFSGAELPWRGIPELTTTRGHGVLRPDLGEWEIIRATRTPTRTEDHPPDGMSAMAVPSVEDRILPARQDRSARRVQGLLPLEQSPMASSSRP